MERLDLIEVGDILHLTPTPNGFSLQSDRSETKIYFHATTERINR